MGDNVGNQLPISAKKEKYTLQFNDGSNDLDGYSNLYARTDPTQGKGCISATCYFGDGGTLSNIGGGGGGGTVTSVGLAAPSAFNVSGTPVTGSGTLTLTGVGTTAQFIDGTGALQTTFTGNVVTGVAPRIAFYSDTEEVSSSIVADITTSNIAVIDGTASTPPFTFKDDPNTGMYRIGADQIGLSTGGVQKVGVYNADSGDFIEGLNVGVRTNIAGIRRVSGTTANSWEDGFMGNSAAIVFTPSDFVVGDSSTRCNQTQSSQPDPAQTRTSRWYGVTSTTGVIVAQKIIPKGFAISDSSRVIIYTPAGNQAGTTCYVSGQSIAIGGAVALNNHLSSALLFTTNLSTPLTGGGTSTGDGRTMVTLYWDAGVQLTTANSPAGAEITIQRV